MRQGKRFPTTLSNPNRSMSNFLSNIRWASEGINYFFKKERNGRIQIIIGFLVIIAGLYFGLKTFEWCFILGCIGVVISLEMVNTGIERICDMLSKDFHPTVKIIKDVAAGAVWWSALFAAIIGAIIFYPYVVQTLR